MNWYLAALKKYAVFSGRSRRKEYWFFFLINLVISCVLAGIDFAMGNLNLTYGYGPLSSCYSLAVFIPGLALTVRRLHDTNRSGWWFLIAFVPCIGALVLLYFMISAGTPGENKFGSDPRASGGVA